MRIPQLSEVRKAVINFCTLVGVLGGPAISMAASLPSPGKWVVFGISCVVGVCGLIVHYYVPNETTDPHIAATQSVRLKKPVRRDEAAA